MQRQNLSPVSEKDQLGLNPVKLPLKRKRFQHDAAQNCSRSADSSSPARGKRRICGEKFVLKRNFSQISTNCRSITEACSSERKGMKKDTDKNESAVTPPSIPKSAAITMIRLKGKKLNDTASSFQNDARSSESKVMEKKRPEDQKVRNIWIVGSSYVKRGEFGARQKFGENLGLNAKVQWFGKGGMGWSGVLPRFYEELSTRSPPDILIIHAGGNDLGLMSAQQLSGIMKTELMQLHKEFPSMTIAYSCINQRQVWRYGSPWKINKDREIVNHTMRKAAHCFGGVIIEHPCLKFFDNTVFVPDGVHFTKKGNELFVTSIRSTIKNILQSTQRKQI